MTENEAKAVKFIENIKNDAVVTLNHIAKEEPNVNQLVFKGRKEKAETILGMVEELKKYRAIGTPEECKKSVSVCRAMIERNITPENMEEYMKFEDECVKNGFTFNSLLEAREKQIPYKPSQQKLVWGIGKCKCGVEFLDSKTNYCGNCGQRLDWSDEE